MPDTVYQSGGSSKSATRNQIDSEWAELRPSLDRVALQARALIAGLRDIPRPLFAGERIWSDQKKAAFAERFVGDLADLLSDLTEPLRTRADDAGIEPDQYKIDLADLLKEYDALCREANQVCVIGRVK